MPVGGEALWIQGEDGLQVTEPELWALLLYIFFFLILFVYKFGAITGRESGMNLKT